MHATFRRRPFGPCMTGDLRGPAAGAVPDRGTRYPSFAIRASGISPHMKRRAAKSERKRSLAYVKRYGTSAALIYVDLDGFKPVNDRHGHGAGDVVLKAIAAALSRNVRASDVVARIGGDEFAVLLWNVNGANAAAKAGALEAAVYGTPVRWNASTLVVGASAGVALLGALDTPADVIARADAAMYARKAERRDGHSGSRVAAARNP